MSAADTRQNSDPASALMDAHAWHWTAAGAAECPVPQGFPSALIFTHGSMALRYYAPKGRDEQLPHGRDEFYVVASGEGLYEIGGGSGEAANPFHAGDALFAPAGVEHCFRDFSDDFGCWVIFYGDKGGEVPGDQRPGSWYWSTAHAEDRKPGENGLVEQFRHGTATLSWYCQDAGEKANDVTRDTLFFVEKGDANFAGGDGRKAPLQAGDVIFIPGGSDFTLQVLNGHFAGWMMSWGPEGGE